MGSLLKRKLGSRILQLGDHGTDVLKLQDYLREQGYDLGDEKSYGYLTKDAVRQFQREHGLIVDGIAGKRFFALMLAKNVSFRHHIHLVQPNESLEQIAKLYNVGPEAFGITSAKKHVYPGQRLRFFHREIWGISHDKLVIADDAELTGIVRSGPPENEQNLPLIISPQEFAAHGLEDVHQVLKSNQERKSSVEKLVSSANKKQGLYLPWVEVPALDGTRYLKFLKSLRKALYPSTQLWVELGPGIPPWRLWGGIDYEAVNGIVDRIVFSLPIPTKPGPFDDGRELDQSLNSLLPYVCSWKVLLKVPVYALEWGETNGEISCGKFAYNTALSRAFRHGARFRKDDAGNVFYHYKNRSGDFQLIFPPYDLMKKVCYVINRQNLAGLVIDRMGYEDPRIWQVIKSYFKAI